MIKLPDDLFYPVNVHTSAIIIQAYQPHDRNNNVLWGWLKDGFVKSKGIMTQKPKGDININIILEAVKTHLSGIKTGSVPKQFKTSPILWDKFIECSPEYYLDEITFNNEVIINEMQKVLNNLVSYKINIL